MGQYLAIGIVTEIGLIKSEIDKYQLNIEQLEEKMKQEFHYVPEIYDFKDDALYSFVLKDEIFHALLIPLLETVYPLLYEKPESYDKIIQELKTLPSSEWLKWAKEKPAEAFQFDKHGMPDYFQIKFSDIRVYYDCLLLSMEGKILMEVFGRQFNFFKYTMRQTFKEFSLAGALRIYITG